MQISTKTRYALRALLDLAEHHDEQPVRVQDISERQQISKKYLEAIFSILKSAGFVSSVRGPNGGYILKRNPSEISLYNIMKVTETSMDIVECLDSPGFCSRNEKCAARLAWKAMKKCMEEHLETVTLTAIINNAKKEASSCRAIAKTS